jgi:hypothetical protein
VAQPLDFDHWALTVGDDVMWSPGSIRFARPLNSAYRLTERRFM